jgi:predicted unusual protein kinase regulating ubiquinone biosynthesis (AarF/ABC1/UbiB family)
MTSGRSFQTVKLGAALARARLFNRDSFAIKRAIFDNFRSLGGVYVKFLQVLATNTNFLDGWGGPGENDVFEHVEHEEIDVDKVLLAEIPNHLNKFSGISRKMLAAGSFAQVYKAKLKDGTDVVIKILRPSVIKNLNRDLRSLSRIVRIMQAMQSGGIINYHEAFGEFKRITRAETDYRQECRNAQWFYEYFAGDDIVVIPKTFAELSTDKLLVQEYIGGVSLADAMTAQQNGADIFTYVAEQTGSDADMWELLGLIGKKMLVAAVSADYVIGDPHPGNIKILPGNKIGFIDFGIAAKAPTSRHSFANFMREYYRLYSGEFKPDEFMKAALQFYDNRLSQALEIVSHNVAGKSLVEAVGSSAQTIFDKLSGSERTQEFINNKRMIQLLTKVINDGNRFNIKLDNGNIAMLRSSIMFMTITQLIAHRAGTNKHEEVLRDTFKYIIDYVDQHGVKNSQTEQNLSDEQATQFFADWAAGVADRDPLLFKQIAGGI